MRAGSCAEDMLVRRTDAVVLDRMTGAADYLVERLASRCVSRRVCMSSSGKCKEKSDELEVVHGMSRIEMNPCRCYRDER